MTMAREGLWVAGGHPLDQDEASYRPREHDQLVTRHPLEMSAAGFVQLAPVVLITANITIDCEKFNDAIIGGLLVGFMQDLCRQIG
jgi:hypothetical protein